jgi:O-Antigen ligase
MIMIIQARTAFLALLVVLLILLMKFRGKALVLRHSGKWLLGLLLVFLGAVAIKRGSTAGRLLIWQVSSGHLADKPLTGYGYASFPSVYPAWQADYFGSGKGTQEYRKVADNVGIAFNEYLNIYLETGIVGLTAFFGILLSFQRQKVSAGDQDGAAGNPERAFYIKLSLGALLLLSLFSYPMQNTTILLLAFLDAGFLSNMAEGGRSVRVSPPIRRAACLLAAGLSLAAGCYFTQRSRDLHRWSAARERITEGDTTALATYAALYPGLYHNAAFAADYGQVLYDAGRYVECCRVLERTAINSVETDNLNLLGLSYQALKRYKASENCFRTNANLVPGALYPKYRLVKLYLETKDTARAMALADTILRMPVKVPSDKAFEIQTEMTRLRSSSAENSKQQ